MCMPESECENQRERERENQRSFSKLNTIFVNLSLLKKDFFSKKSVRVFISYFISISLLGVLHICI